MGKKDKNGPIILERWFVLKVYVIMKRQKKVKL